MRRIRNVLSAERKPDPDFVREQSTDDNLATVDRCESVRNEPPVVSRIAQSFWCKPTRPASAGKQQTNRVRSLARTESVKPARGEQLLTCFALVLAAVAAILSAQGHTNHMLRMGQWLMSGTAPEAVAVAGAIGENPDLLDGR